MQGKNITIYIKGDRETEVTKPDVTLGDLLSMECTDKVVLARLKAEKILRLNKTGKQRCVVSVLRIISCIHQLYPQAEVQNLGEPDLIVTYEQQKSAPSLWYVVKVAFASVALFCGAAFSIMAFHNDVDVTTLFGQIYQLVTGEKSSGFTVLEAAYSVGLTAGILIFFNHFGKKRFTVDPTPVEVQMRVYENDIQTTLIENASRKGEELDADPTGSSGGSGS